MKRIDGDATIRIGIMGAGAVADFGHGPAIAAEPGLTLHSIYDPVFERAVALQKKFGAPHAFHDRDLFFNSGIEAVTICSPAPTHRENVLTCARKGFPVLCEKPLAMNDAEGEEMIQAMKHESLPLAVGFCYRFSPVAQEIKRLVEIKAVGEIRSLRLIYIWNLHGIYENDSEGRKVYSPQRVARMEEGGPMVDCGVHQIDLARWWLQSEVQSWTSAGAWVENFESPDHVFLHLRHESGTLSTVEMSFTYGHTIKDPISQFCYELIGTEGVIRYDRNAGTFEVRTENGTQYLPWSHEKNFEGMYSEWNQTLRTGELESMPTGVDGLVAVRISREATLAAIRTRHA